jgi:hypothetical protein
MKRLLAVTLLFFSLAKPVLAQTSEPPFSSLDKRVKAEQGGWGGSKEELSRVFRAERARLGPCAM